MDGDRPVAPPPAVRVALGVGIALGFVSLAVLVTRAPGGLAVNLEVYYYAGRALLSGGDLYAVTPPAHPTYRFLYPPAVGAVLAPYALAPDPLVAFAVHTCLQVAATLALAAVVVRYVERRRGRLPPVDRLLVAGFLLASVHSVPTLFFGNVNLLLAAALGTGLLWLDRHPRRAGALLAVPAVVKVFPVAVGSYLVVRRAWRSVAAAVAVGAGAVAASLLAFGPALHREYLRAAGGRLDPSLYAGGMSPDVQMVTVRRPLSVLFPGADPAAITLGTALLVVPVVAYLLPGARGDEADRLVAAHGVLVGTILFFPSLFVYVALAYVPLVPLLYLLEGTPRTVFAAGVAAASLPFSLSDLVEAVRTLPPVLSGPLVAVLRPALTVGSSPLYGLALTLVACVLYRHRRGSTDVVAN